MRPVGFSDSRLVNLSVRTPLADGQNLIFRVRNGERELLLRAVGPSLTTYVSDAHPDTTLDLYLGADLIDQNDNWASDLDAAMASVGAFPLTAGSNPMQALVKNLSGAHSAHIRGAGTGTILLEVYDLP